MLPNSSKNKKTRFLKNMLKPLLFWFLLLTILGFLAITNIKIKERREKLSGVIEELKKEIAELEKKNEDLKAKISQFGTKEYLERVAREQFNLKAPGEEVVIISKDNKEEKKESDNFSEKKEQRRKLFDIKKLWNFLKSFWEE